MAVGRKSKAQVAKVRKLVFERDGDACVVSHTKYWASCTGELTIQHRIARGMGSSALVDEPKYLVSMCAYHNFLDASDAVFHKFCIEQGYSAPRWILNRHQINRLPVCYADGWYLLDGNERFEIPESTAKEMMSEIYDE